MQSKADYQYILKELGDTPSVWALECYPKTKQLHCIGDTGGMYIVMKPNTTEAEAKQIQRLLNEHVAHITASTS